MKKVYLIISAGTVTLNGCGQDIMTSAVAGMEDPTERGLMYIAVALIIAAFLRGIWKSSQ